MPVTAYMATIIKAGILLAVVRLFGTAPVSRPMADVLAILPLISIVWGNLAAMRQTSFRRMIAYSSIAHAGYLFYALLGEGPDRHPGQRAGLFSRISDGVGRIDGHKVQAQVSQPGRLVVRRRRDPPRPRTGAGRKDAGAGRSSND